MRGFTLTETLVGVAIGAIILIGVVALLSNSGSLQDRQFAIADADRETSQILGTIGRIFQSKRKGPRFKGNFAEIEAYDPFYCASHVAAETAVVAPGVQGINRCYSYYIDDTTDCERASNPAAPPFTNCRRILIWRGWPDLGGGSFASNQELFEISSFCQPTGLSSFEAGINFPSRCNLQCGDDGQDSRPVIRIRRLDGNNQDFSNPDFERIIPAFARVTGAGRDVRSSQKASLGQELCISLSDPNAATGGTITFEISSFTFDRNRNRSDRDKSRALVNRIDRIVLPEFSTISPAVEYFPNQR